MTAWRVLFGMLAAPVLALAGAVVLSPEDPCSKNVNLPGLVLRAGGQVQYNPYPSGYSWHVRKEVFGIPLWRVRCDSPPLESIPYPSDPLRVSPGTPLVFEYHGISEPREVSVDGPPGSPQSISG